MSKILRSFGFLLLSAIFILFSFDSKVSAAPTLDSKFDKAVSTTVFPSYRAFFENNSDWLTAILDSRPYTFVSLEKLYYLQTESDERVINLEDHTYLINFTSSEVSDYLDVYLPEYADLTKKERQEHLRDVSGALLSLVLYRIGGDGTDHLRDCRNWVTAQLPQRQSVSGVSGPFWAAEYSGFLIDLSGHCRELDGPSASFIQVKIVLDPVTEQGQILVSGLEIFGTLGQDFFFGDDD